MLNWDCLVRVARYSMPSRHHVDSGRCHALRRVAVGGGYRPSLLPRPSGTSFPYDLELSTRTDDVTSIYIIHIV